jgi:hypothetical protein
VLDPQATATMLYQQWLGASLLSRLSRDRASDGSRHAGHATRAGAATVAPFVLAPYVHPERTSHEQHPQTNRRIVLASRPLRHRRELPPGEVAIPELQDGQMLLR